MGTRLRALASESPVVGDVRISGVIQGVELVRDKKTKAKFDDARAVSALVTEAGREHGVLLNCQFSHYGNIITMYLPLTSEDAELTTVCNAIEDAARRVEKTFV